MAIGERPEPDVITKFQTKIAEWSLETDAPTTQALYRDFEGATQT